MIVELQSPAGRNAAAVQKQLPFVWSSVRTSRLNRLVFCPHVSFESRRVPYEFDPRAPLRQV
jgi:hypothetical protein